MQVYMKSANSSHRLIDAAGVILYSAYS